MSYYFCNILKKNNCIIRNLLYKETVKGSEPSYKETVKGFWFAAQGHAMFLHK